MKQEIKTTDEILKEYGFIKGEFSYEEFDVEESEKSFIPIALINELLYNKQLELENDKKM